jgi:chromosome segregation ATPase
MRDSAGQSAESGRARKDDQKMSETPRTNNHVDQFPDCRREPRLLDLCRRLEAEFAEARAEIERLQIEVGDLIKEGCLQRHTIGEQEAEIERLKARNAILDAAIADTTEEQAVLCAEGQSITELVAGKDKLIEQMREALVAAKNDGKMQSAITYQLIIAALSAAERGK